MGGLARALHDERVNFNTDQSVFDWAAAKGIDMKKFGNAYNAFSMANLVAQGDKDAAAYRISGVPAVTVDGRWLVLPRHTQPEPDVQWMVAGWCSTPGPKATAT